MRYYQTLKDFFKIYKSAFLSGVLFGASFIPFPFFLLFFCLVPLWLFIYKQNSLKRVLTACFVTQFIATLVGFNWMIYTVHAFGGINWFLSFIVLLLFCAVGNCYVMLSGALWFFVTKKSALKSTGFKLILFPLIFSVFHSLIPTLFPWDMGYPWFWGGLWGAQTAELWGFRFLNTLFYIFNLLFLIVYYHFYKRSQKEFSKNKIKKIIQWFGSFCLDKTGALALLSAVFLFVFLNILGFYLKNRLPEPDKTLNAILIQHNISLADTNPKPFKSFKKKAFYTLKNLTYHSLRQASKATIKTKDIDFILWPEGAYPYNVNENSKKQPGLSRLVKVMRIPLITGAISKHGEDYKNSVIILDREGNLLKPFYSKIKLLIFGEYIPLVDKLTFLKKMFPYFGSSLTPGSSILVQDLEGKKIGWQICYEALFDDLNRDLANKKAQIVLNVTNDSWYGSWQQPTQHLAMSFARAIEIRRPILRSTNTGYSGVVYADGTVPPYSPLNKEWFKQYKVPYYTNPPKTLFMSWGYYINEIFLSLLLLLAWLWNRKFEGT